MGNQGEAPNTFERGQGKVVRVCQVSRGQRKFSLNGVVDRYLDTNCISSFHISQDSENNLRAFPLS